MIRLETREKVQQHASAWVASIIIGAPAYSQGYTTGMVCRQVAAPVKNELQENEEAKKSPTST